MPRPTRQAGARRSKPKETSKIDFVVGERMRDLRLSRDLSQRSLGELIGVTFQQVQKYEKGTNRITVARLNDVCGVFNVGFDYFLGNPVGAGADGMAEGETPTLSPSLSEDEKALLKAFRNVSARRRKAILGLIQDMVGE